MHWVGYSLRLFGAAFGASQALLSPTLVYRSGSEMEVTGPWEECLLQRTRLSNLSCLQKRKKMHHQVTPDLRSSTLCPSPESQQGTGVAFVLAHPLS